MLQQKSLAAAYTSIALIVQMQTCRLLNKCVWVSAFGVAYIYKKICCLGVREWACVGCCNWLLLHIQIQRHLHLQSL